MKSTVVKRSIVIECKKTSISIEEPFWRELREIADEQKLSLSSMVGAIKSRRAENSNLSSAVRVFVVSHLKEKAALILQVRGGAVPAEGHAPATATREEAKMTNVPAP